MRPVRRFTDQDALRSARARQKRLIPFGDWLGLCPNNRRITLERAFHPRLRIVLGALAGRFGEPRKHSGLIQTPDNAGCHDREAIGRSVFTYVAVSPRVS